MFIYLFNIYFLLFILYLKFGVDRYFYLCLYYDDNRKIVYFFVVEVLYSIVVFFVNLWDLFRLILCFFFYKMYVWIRYILLEIVKYLSFVEFWIFFFLFCWFYLNWIVMLFFNLSKGLVEIKVMGYGERVEIIMEWIGSWWFGWNG